MGGSPVRDGALFLDGFNTSATALVKRWQEVEVDESLPDWTWRPCCRMGVPSEVEGYLALEGVYRNSGQGQIGESNDFDNADMIADDSWVQSSSDAADVYDFHVIYSHSYRVPVLYFQGHHASGKLLTLDEIKQDLPSNSVKVLNKSKWTFITREEHPYLSRPWFTLHPCGTSYWMKILLQETQVADKGHSLKYLPAWLSVVGQAVGLKIPLEIYCNS